MRPNRSLKWARTYVGLAQLLIGDHASGLEGGFGICHSSYVCGMLAYAHTLAGDHSAARALVNQLQERSRSEFVTPQAMALALLGLGERDTALDCLEHMVEGGYNTLGLGISPLIDQVRGELCAYVACWTAVLEAL